MPSIHVFVQSASLQWMSTREGWNGITIVGCRGKILTPLVFESLHVQQLVHSIPVPPADLVSKLCSLHLGQ
jgi:hypothetical protein